MDTVNPFIAEAVPEAFTPVNTVDVPEAEAASKYFTAPVDVAVLVVNETDSVGVNVTEPVADLKKHKL